MAANEDLLLRYAMRMIGQPYIWGGSSPLVGFDCSGLVLELLMAWGKWPKDGGDTNAQGIHGYLSRELKRQTLTLPDFGALAFYGKSLSDISHIAFCLSDTLMIEAGGGDHTTVSAEEARKRGASVRLRPIRRRADLVDVLMS